MTKFLNLTYNAAVYRHVKISPKQYTAKSKQYGKRLEMWRYHSTKAQIDRQARELLLSIEKQVEKLIATRKNDN